MAEQKDLWGTICERAGIEREEGEIGPPMHLPMGREVVWASSSGKQVQIEVGSSIPIKKDFVAVAIFQDDNAVRVYGVPEAKAEKTANEDDAQFRLRTLARRWTLTKTSPTMCVVEIFIDPDIFVDAVACEILAAEAEFETLRDTCPRCETLVSDDAQYCKGCGLKLPDDEEGATKPTASTAVAPSPQA